MKIHAKVRPECTFLTIVSTDAIQRQTRNSRQMETESHGLHSSCQLHSPKTPLVSTCIGLNKHHFIWLTLPLAIKGPVNIPKTHAETCGSSSYETEGSQLGSLKVKSLRIHGHYYH